MSLNRQVALSIILLFVLGFTGIMAISTSNLRSFLLTQFESHAQDTATSLGLSLSQPMQSQDMPVINSMVDVVFDRGYYREIQVQATSGELLVSRTSPVEVETVPAWFVRLITLPAPTATALVMSGWKQAASVTVTSHPGYAYLQLWTNTVETFRLFLVSAVIILIAGLAAVFFLLRPLRQVEFQADAICNGVYPIQKHLPRTRELRAVVMAMNRLSEKINAIFSEQAALTERLREQAFKDPVTELGNRRYFDRQLQALLTTQEDASQGALLILELNGLTKINQTAGYPAGDALLKRTGDLISTRIDTTGSRIVARISGACFAIVATGYSKDSAVSLADNLCRDCLQLQADGLIDDADIVHIGIALWTQDSLVHELLSAADTALCAARASHENSWQLSQPAAAGKQYIHGRTDWRQLLQQTLDTENVTLYAQPVYPTGMPTEQLLHKEIYLRIQEANGESVKAGIFMPMAEQTGLAGEIDRLAIGKILDRLASGSDRSMNYAINLAATSLHDREFIRWLYHQLEAAPDSARRILLELPEVGVLKNVREACAIVERLNHLGCRCGIDHFGRGFHSFSYLRSIQVSYVKLDGSLTRDIDTDEDNRFYLQALIDTAHSIDIKVIAQAVETKAEQTTLLTMNVDGIQGYLAGKPEEL